MAAASCPKKKVLVIGMGAGHPDYLTVQAINALNRVDVFFLVNKGTEKGDLLRIRREICERFIESSTYRCVEFADPARVLSDPAYTPDIRSWREKRALLYRSLIADSLQDGECGAFLVWGDPALYDGTLAILAGLLAEGTLAFDYEAVPGISSMQALAARHRIALNRIGETIQITTGRQIAGGFPEGADSVVVLLDTKMDLHAISGDVYIYWGAYLGTEDEVLVSGRLHEVRADIERIRSAKRAEKGWIMDTYLLRRNGAGNTGGNR